eukprot:1011799-Rhodomonas_salina.3
MLSLLDHEPLTLFSHRGLNPAKGKSGRKRGRESMSLARVASVTAWQSQTCSSTGASVEERSCGSKKESKTFVAAR